MELYKIIANIDEFITFLDWLPDLQENEKFYCCLFARKKYAPVLKDAGGDKAQLKRFTATKENLLYKIRQLEIPLGRYKIKNIEVPDNSLVLYLNPNPRSMIKANEKMGPHCWSLTKSNGFDLAQEAMSMIQQSCSRRVFKDLDIDTKDIDLHKLKLVFPTPEFKGVSVYSIVETNGGYHILVNTKAADASIKHYNALSGTSPYTTMWYKVIERLYPLDKHNDKSDRLLPVPGTFQGGHIVKFVNL